MTEPPRLNFQRILRQAAGEAKEQEERSQEALLGSVMLRAARDDKLRLALQTDPVGVLARETSGRLAPDVAQAADRVLSQAVPGTDAKRVEELVFSTVEDMRTSFRLTLELSKWLFIAGLVMVALAFLAALFSNKLWAVGVSGSAGTLSLLLSALRNPLDRIRNAAGNLVQIQAAYLGFYKQLYMLGGGVPALSRTDAVAYAKEIQGASDAMVKSISDALERGQRVVEARRRKGGVADNTIVSPGASQPAMARPVPRATHGPANAEGANRPPADLAAR